MTQFSWKRRQKELKAMITPNAIIVEQASIKPYTVVRVAVGVRTMEPSESLIRIGVGMAKLSDRDTWNYQRGVEIAKGRAIDDIARRLMRDERAQQQIYDYAGNPYGLAKEAIYIFTCDEKKHAPRPQDITEDEI